MACQHQIYYISLNGGSGFTRRAQASRRTRPRWSTLMCVCVLWEEKIFPPLKWNIWQLEQVIIAVTKWAQLQQLWIPCSATHNQLSVYLDAMLPSPKYTQYSTYSVFKAVFVIIGKNDKITILIKITTNSPTQQLSTDISGTLLMKFYSSGAQMWREKCSQKLSQCSEHMWFLIAWQRRCLILWMSWKQPVSVEEIQHDIIEPVWRQRGRALFGLLWWRRGEKGVVGARVRWAIAGDPACLSEYPPSVSIPVMDESYREHALASTSLHWMHFSVCEDGRGRFKASTAAPMTRGRYFIQVTDALNTITL